MSHTERKYNVATPQDIEAANRRFNEELSRQIAGELEAGHVYDLGYPGEILQAAGFPDNKIEMLSRQLTKKSTQENHPFDIADVKGLVTAINTPVAVFVYGSKSKAQNVIIEQERKGKKFLVGVHFNQQHDSTLINSVRGLFPKDNAEWLNWIQLGKLLYVDKEKIQSVIAKQRSHPADVSHLDLDFVAKVVENFENPKFFNEKIDMMEEISQMDSRSVLAYVEENYPGLVLVFKDRASDPAAKAFSADQLDVVVDARDRHVMSADQQKQFFDKVWDAMANEGLLDRLPVAWVADAVNESHELCEGKPRNIEQQLHR